MELGIVVPCYNEEEVLPETARRLLELLVRLKAAGKVGDRSRIWFVDDGSRDNTWPIIERLSAENTALRGIKLSRNRGHQNALIAGASIVWSGQFFKVEKTEQPQAMIRLHDHDIKVARQVGSILMGCAARANDKTAAMVIQHNRTLPVVIGGGPYVKE